MISVKKTIIYLDMVLLIMTGGWILFGLSKGIDNIELAYNYVYVIIAIITFILNIKVLQEEK